MRYADPAECGLPFAGGEDEPWDGSRYIDGREMQLRPRGPGSATAVGSGIGLEIHTGWRANPKVRGEGGTAERRVAAHGGVGAVSVVVDHPGGARMRTRPHEDDAIGADPGAPRADGLHVFRRPIGRRGHTRIQHDEIVARSRHFVDRQTDQMRPNQAMSRRRGTFHTASRTMARFILLCPSARSTNTIGISRSLNPFRHARTLISI